MEDLYRYLGNWGTYQTRIFLLLSICIISSGMQAMLPVVIFHIPRHRCQIPAWPGDTYAIQSEEHQLAVNQSIPLDQGSYSQCSVFSSGNLTGEDSANGTAELSRPQQDCQVWVYDTSEVETSLITQFDLVCDKKTYRAHMYMLFLVGTLVSSTVVGYLCDWFGRKSIMYICCLLCLIVGLASAYPPSVEVFLAYRFLLGLSINATYMSVFVLVVELVGPPSRTRAATILTILWLVGPFLSVGLSFLVRQWHYLQLIAALSLTPCISYWWFLPESPRWLLITKKTKAALKVLEKAARVNNMPCAPSSETIAKLGLELESTENNGVKIMRNIRQLFRFRHMVIVSVIVFFNWFVVAMVYYGLTISVGSLDGDVRINFFLSCTMELIGYVLAWVLLDRLGRKWSHCCFMLTAGLALLATVVTVSVGGPKLRWVTTALAMGGKLGVSASFTAVYLISAEIFPTVIRNFGVAFSSAWGSVGDTMSPYIVDLSLHIPGTFGKALPLVLFGGLAFLAGLSALYLPETLNQTLPDTLEEAVSFIKGCKDKKKEGELDEEGDEEAMQRSSLLTQATSAV